VNATIGASHAASTSSAGASSSTLPESHDVPAPAPTLAGSLGELYPTHLSSLAALADPGYRDAYKSFLRTRIYLWVLGDIGQGTSIGSGDIMRWVGTATEKTMKNYVSRFNQAKRSLDFLRKMANPLEEDLRDMLTLGVLVEGPLSPIPIDRDERDDDADHQTIDRVLQLSINRLETINRRVKAISG
jgi:hypothetical protein